MKSKQLATISLIIMALVSTPRAMQQLRDSLDAAQQRAGLIWWDLLLTRDAQATESATTTKTNRCPQVIAARVRSPGDTFSARSVVKSHAAQTSLDARKAQRQSAASNSSELAVNNYPPDQDGSSGFVAPDQQVATQQQQHALQNFVPTAAQEASQALMTPEIRQALASLKERQAPTAPAFIPVAGELDNRELAQITRMDALMAVLAKKGLNIQFKLRKMTDGNALPRAKARPQINKSTDNNTLISRLEGRQCPAG